MYKAKVTSRYMASGLLGLMLAAATFASCDDSDMPAPGSTPTAPEGMVEVHPVLPGVYSALHRDNPDTRGASTRAAYEEDEETEEKLVTNETMPLPEGSTVWLIAKNSDGKLVKNSYVVYNSTEEDNSDVKSYLVPCEVDSKGKMTSIEGRPLYLKANQTYEFYAVSPARKLDDALFAQGVIGFKIKNGEYFYANDCRYSRTSPGSATISMNDADGVQEIILNPMINQTAQLKFWIFSGEYVHDLDMQPTGMYISGLQKDSTSAPYGDADGIQWKMSMTDGDQPILLQHGEKKGTYNEYDYQLYQIDAKQRVLIHVGIIPMYSIPKPVIVVFRMKVNGVPSSYEMMLNEKDFKAGYSYEYHGTISIKNGVDVISWQYLGWSIDVDFPFENNMKEQ